MKNTIPKFRPEQERQKNRVDLNNLFFLNARTNVRSSNVRKDGVDTAIVEEIKNRLKEGQNKELIKDAFGNDSKRQRLLQEIKNILSEPAFAKQNEKLLADVKLNEVANQIVEKIVGLDVLEALTKDPYITDISVNGHDNIWVDHILKGDYQTDVKFDSEQSYLELLHRFAFASDKTFSYGNPSFDAMFPHIRVNVVGHDLSPTPTLQMRIVSKDLRLSKDYMLETGYLDEKTYQLLSHTFPTHSYLIGGETGTGKTELLRYLVRYTKPQKPIIMIEDTPESYLDEIYPKDKYSIKMWRNRASVGGNDKEFGFKFHLLNAMRNNPTYIYIQESRGGEAVEISKAVSTGHIVGTSLHSKSCVGSVNRFIDLCQEGKMQSVEMYGSRITGEDGFRIGVHLKRFGNVRRINEVFEYTGFENGKAVGNMLIKYNEFTGEHESLAPMSERLWEELQSYHKDMTHLEEFSPYKVVKV